MRPLRWLGELIDDATRGLFVVRVVFKYFTGPALRKVLGLPQGSPSPSERLRLALEELEITYVKLGQYLATRFDILPLSVCDELNKLFDSVPPFPPERVAAIVESELGRPLQQIFPFFEINPIAAASVAQVHEARLPSGARVAIKIQRPGIERVFRSDMRNLKRLAAVADYFHLLGLVSIEELIAEFDRWTSRELDFRLEGHTADVIRSNTTSNEVIPFIYWDLTTSRILTMEFLEGVSLAKVADLISEGKDDELRRLLPRIDVREVGHNLCVACLTQLFITGVFHGDPHPANVLIRDDNKVAFVDFGIFGELGIHERQTLTLHIENIAVGNIDESYRYYVSLLFASPDADMEGFAREAKSIFRGWYEASQNPNAPMEDKHLGKYTAQIFDAVRRYRLRLVLDTLLFWRAMNTLDSTALRLSGVFDLLEELRLFFENTRPTAVERALKGITERGAMSRFVEFVISSPGDLRRILDQLAGDKVWDSSLLETAELEKQNDRQTVLLAASILGVSLITLAAAIGSSMGVWFAAAAAFLYGWIGIKAWYG